MSEARGYIKLYRSLLDNPVICKDSERMAIWIYLLLNATHAGQRVVFNGQKIELQPGQMITGRKAISKALNIDEYKIQRVLKCFESEQQIAQQTSPRNRIVSVLNWQQYQETAQPNAHLLHNNCTTTAHKQECKNEKNENNSMFFDQFWKAYPKKEGKQEALKAFGKIKLNPDLFNRIMAALETQKQTAVQKKAQGEFVPAWKNAQGWLNGKRWEDEAPDDQEQAAHNDSIKWV